MREPKHEIAIGDNRSTLEAMLPGHFHCCATSPPYFGQRDYGKGSADAAEIGREEAVEAYVDALVNGTFARVRRVLRDDGMLFVNLGDKYEPGTKQLLGVPWQFALAMQRAGWVLRQEIIWAKAVAFTERHAEKTRRAVAAEARALGLDAAAAARLAGRVETLVGSVLSGSSPDRCTTSHETVFVFSKQPKYYADMEAVKEQGCDWGTRDRSKWKARDANTGQTPHRGSEDLDFAAKGRNLRTVWVINTQPTKGSGHYAPWPPRLVEPMILMSTSDRGCCPHCGTPVVRVVESRKVTRVRPNELTKRTGEAGTGNACANTVDGSATRTKGWRPGCGCAFGKDDAVPCRVLDPFGGRGTTAAVARGLGRDCTLCELYPEYAAEIESYLASARFERSQSACGEPRREARLKRPPEGPTLFDEVVSCAT